MRQLSDKTLITAVRKRLLREIQREQAQQGMVTNNVYGGGIGGHSGMGQDSGLMEKMQADDPYDYQVDISRMPGEVEGSWNKKVTRTRLKKKD